MCPDREFLPVSNEPVCPYPRYGLRGIWPRRHSRTTGVLLDTIAGRVVIVQAISMPPLVQKSVRLQHSRRRGQYSDGRAQPKASSRDSFSTRRSELALPVTNCPLVA